MVESLKVIEQSSNFLEFSWFAISTADSYSYKLTDTLSATTADVISFLLSHKYKHNKNQFLKFTLKV